MIKYIVFTIIYKIKSKSVLTRNKKRCKNISEMFSYTQPYNGTNLFSAKKYEISNSQSKTQNEQSTV